MYVLLASLKTSAMTNGKYFLSADVLRSRPWRRQGGKPQSRQTQRTKIISIIGTHSKAKCSKQVANAVNDI
jgi:hypothetical protein